MYKAKKFISYMALCVLIFSLCACGEKGSENAAIYGETVGGLEDNELFAIIDTNAFYLFYLLPHKYIMTVWEIRQHLIVMYII